MGFIKYYLYIIQSQKDNSFYIGHTKDIRDRLSRHNNKRSKYSKTKIPWKIVYIEKYNTKSEAMKREYEIKKKKSRKFIELLILGDVA